MPRKTETKAAEPTPAPIVGPQTRDEWYQSTLEAVLKKDAPLAAREEYRKLLTLFPATAREYGDLPTICRRQALERFELQPITEDAVQHQMLTLRRTLLGTAPTPVETLLVDVVVLCWQDYWMYALIRDKMLGTSCALSELEEWDRILASKEARYLRAVETLARVRRLLKLPALQVNIATAGGQQVNIAGELPTARPVAELPPQQRQGELKTEN